MTTKQQERLKRLVDELLELGAIIKTDKFESAMVTLKDERGHHGFQTVQ